MSKENKSKKPNQTIEPKQNAYGLVVQLLLVLAVVVLLILSAFDRIFLTIAEIVTGAALIAMAYNNHTVYNRKYLTIIYVIFGLLVIVDGVVSLIG